MVAASKNKVSSAILERRVEICRPARDAVRLRQLRELSFIAADQDRVGHHPVAVLERDAALRADRDDRADQVLVHPHAAGDAVHDDAETLLRHSSFLTPISQQPIDAPGIFAEFLVGLHFERARMRKLDAEIVRHARRPGCEHDHPRAEKHRLGDAVGHKDDGLFRFFPDAQELDIHLLARERIERAERLVHQDELGIVNERARDRGALLHAAGKLVGVFVLVALEPDEREEVARPGAALRHGKPQNLRRQKHIVDHAPPFQQ